MWFLLHLREAKQRNHEFPYQAYQRGAENRHDIQRLHLRGSKVTGFEGVDPKRTSQLQRQVTLELQEGA